jgi:hypothetical protein
MRRTEAIHASTQHRNSSPKPIRRDSYHADASVRSCSTSGAMTSLAAMATANSTFDFLPREPRGRVLHQVGLSPVQFLFLPIMDRHSFRGRRKVVPQVLHELEFLCRTQIKDGGRCSVHSDTPVICFQFSCSKLRRQAKTPIVNQASPEFLIWASASGSPPSCQNLLTRPRSAATMVMHRRTTVAGPVSQQRKDPVLSSRLRNAVSEAGSHADDTTDTRLWHKRQHPTPHQTGTPGRPECRTVNTKPARVAQRGHQRRGRAYSCTATHPYLARRRNRAKLWGGFQV